jgi:hypothetical protein
VDEKVQLSLCLTEHYDMMVYGGMDYIVDVDACFLDPGIIGGCVVSF